MRPVDALRRRAGKLRGNLRRGRDRVLHPMRFARARARLRQMPRPRTILVVCHGNICRSPYLAAVLQRSLPDVRVTSAGFVGPDRGVPSHGLTAAGRRGISLGEHRSRLLSAEIARAAELAIVMDQRQARGLLRQGIPAERIVVAGDLDPEPSDQRTIDDPWGRDLDAFAMSYARLDRCALTLVESLQPPGFGRE